MFVFYLMDFSIIVGLNSRHTSSSLSLCRLKPELSVKSSLQERHSCSVTCYFHVNSVCQIWSVTTGALLDALCGSDAPVTSVVLCDGVVVSASTAAACVHLWSLKYDDRHKPAAHIPAGCAHVAVTKDTDQVFYVRQQSHTEVISWNNRTGQSRHTVSL